LLELEAELAPLLVREFSDRYEAFLAGARFTERFLKYLESNPAAATHVGGALVGAMLGAAMTKKSQGALIGAGVGVLIAALIHSQSLNIQQLDMQRSP
jgi:preprotein translocase subunit SecY